MEDELSRIWQEITSRPTGPFAFRFYFQPIMATFFALRDGIKDAHTGEPPYFWALFTQPERFRELVASGWKAVGKVFILAIVLDVIYQFVVLHGLRPVQGLLIAVVLAVVPYVLLRGPVTRFVRRFGHEAATSRAT